MTTNIYLDILLGVCILFAVFLGGLFLWELACIFYPKMHGLSLIREEKGEDNA